MIDESNRTRRPVVPPTVVDGFVARVRRDPGAVAMTDGGREVSYARLWAAVVRVRDSLREAGVDRGEVVALVGRRSVGLAAATFGVWLAGAMYLPLDPGHPEQRLRLQLDDAGARAVIADPGVAPSLRAGRAVIPISDLDVGPVPPVADIVPPAADAGAYLIYTSGSTGQPKGTLVSHRALANVVAHFARELSCTPGDATVWLSTFSFDISALELYLPLTTGGRAVVAPDRARTDGQALREVLTRYDHGVVQATPTTWRLVLAEVAAQLRRWRVLSGGEPLSHSLAQRLVATGCELRNVYGPTETTIWSTSGVVDISTGGVDVGKPITNTTVFVLGEHGTDLPIGVRGELCIAGAGVAIGYHRRPDLTAKRFGTHPKYGRYYRTGDLARWLPQGRLEVSGRIDRQIKLHGHRIELGEIENVLLEHADVDGAAVVVAGENTGGPVIVAFVVGGPGPAGRLRDHARRLLPRVSVPHSYIRVESFPRTGNDKVNYRELASMAAKHLEETRRGGTAAGGDDDVIGRLIEMWRRLLGGGPVCAETDFFAGGGNSLLGARLLQQVETDFGVSIALAELLDNPTPSLIARRVRADTRAE